MVLSSQILSSLIPKPKLTKYIPHKPTPKQYAFLCYEGLDGFYGGAAGGGKSDALLMASLQYVDVPNYNAIILRDTYKNLSEPGALMDRANEWLRPTDAKWMGGKNERWLFPSGATLSFGYLAGPNDHHNYQSSEFQFVGIDEATNIRGNQAVYMFSRLRRLAGSDIPIRFRCASNPPQPEQLAKGEWVKIRYVDPLTRKKDAIFIPAKLEDNPHLDKEEYIKSLMELDPVTRAQLLQGDWEIRVKGRFFDRSWFEIVQAAPAEVLGRVRFWDRAATEESKANKEPAYTTGLRMSKTKAGIYYIESVVRFRKSSRANEAIIRQVADMDGQSISIRMEQEPGSSGKDTIDNYRRRILPEFDFKGIVSTGSKPSRAGAFASQAEAGNVKLVAGHWNKDYLDELDVFPDGTFKDQADASSGGFNFLAGIGTSEFRMRFV